MVTDVMAVGETLQAFLEESIRAHIHARHRLLEAQAEQKNRSVLLLSADREMSRLRAFALERGYTVTRAIRGRKLSKCLISSLTLL